MLAPAAPPARPLPRLVVSADFERVLAVRRRAATAHFAVHHVAAQPSAPPRVSKPSATAELSTAGTIACSSPVEDLVESAAPHARAWVGAIVPKRHARRAVTRSLIKRQIYAAAERYRYQLAPGLWIVRLRAPFDRVQFVSAGSLALVRHARAELDGLLAAAVAAPSS